VQRFLREVPSPLHDRYHTMKGRDVTTHMSPAHWLFEEAPKVLPIKTIGIGDGGNEIGMGKIPWEVIRRNIRNGAQVACRVPTDYLLVCGVSNWGAYGLAAAIGRLKGIKLDADLFDIERERKLLRIMVEQGPLVDGVSGQPSVTVDGLSFERYAEPLRRLGAIETAPR
jgi:D-glutamate cyclase